MSERILCVDDEPLVLQGMERTLGDVFEVVTAGSGDEGLVQLQTGGPFAVVISDMRMPRMDGATFLSAVKRLAPDTVRLLLTGETDVKSAILAVNEGAIFRFLTKPCAPDTLVGALQMACAQHRLLRAERELLDHTLQGVIHLVGEVLEIVAPLAGQTSRRTHALVQHIVRTCGIENGWKVEAAAQLSQLGCVALPPSLVEASFMGVGMTPKDREAVRAHPATTQRLVREIPRLGEVGDIVRAHVEALPASATDDVSRGALVLALASAIALTLTRGGTLRAALESQRSRIVPAQRPFLDALATFQEASDETCTVRVKDLRPRMTLAEPLVTLAGVTLAPMGQELSALALERIRRFADGVGLPDVIRVKPARAA